MTLFEVDGGNEIAMAPESSAIGILYSGERIDLTVECFAKPDDGDSYSSITLDAE